MSFMCGVRKSKKPSRGPIIDDKPILENQAQQQHVGYPVFIGLDFGTFHSTVSVWKGGKSVLADLQGTTRVLSMVAGSEQRYYFAKEAMNLMGVRASNLVQVPKLCILRGDIKEEKLLQKYFEFMKMLAVPHEPNLNSVVVCLPGRGLVKLKELLASQFPTDVRFISDVAAVFMNYLEDRHGANVKHAASPFSERFVVVNLGAGFISCGEVRVTEAAVRVERNESLTIGGAMLVDAMGQFISSKVDLPHVNAPGRFWGICKEKMDILIDTEIVEVDLTQLGCEESVEVKVDDLTLQVTLLSDQMKGLVKEILGTGDNTTILLSGGMGHFRPFREWLDSEYPKQVEELFNMNSACAYGAAFYAGVLNCEGSKFRLEDCATFDC